MELRRRLRDQQQLEMQSRMRYLYAEAEAEAQRQQFMKNMMLMGGIIIIGSGAFVYWKNQSPAQL